MRLGKKFSFFCIFYTYYLIKSFLKTADTDAVFALHT